MRVAAHKASNGALSTRERLIRDRLRAAPLRHLFPEIQQLRITLVFDEPEARTTTPSPQLHTLYAAASAFFRFPCPCSDCDGEFDLTEAVKRLTTSSATRARATSLSGHSCCQGIRFRAQAAHQRSCPMQLHFELIAESERAA